MKVPMSILKTLTSMLILLVVQHANSQSDIYWVGGNGDWNDVGMWYKDALGMNAAGIIPNANSIVHFTDHSSNIADWNVRLQPGSYDVHSILVETADDFRIFLNGTDNNEVEVTVHGDISFLSTHRLEYASTFLLNNKWIFIGTNNHDVATGGQNMSNIEINNPNRVFNQLDDLTVSEQIRMFAGTWNSNGHDITAGKLLFEDDEPSSSPLPKLFNSASSEILCQEWESGFTYGSLTVTGNHTIKTRRFRGSPKQQNGIPFNFHEVHLLEYPDVAVGTPIEYNNFECRGCIVESIVILDTGDTKLADEFTVNGKFTVVNLGSSILFNGGNGRDSEVTFNGLIITPKVVDCDDELTIFSSIHTDESLFIRNSSSLEVSDAILNNIEAVGNATFNLSKGILQGASSGWNLISPPDGITYYWRGVAGVAEDWNDPNNWVLQSGNGNGCIPTLADDVYVDGNAKGDIRIPRPYNAECNNFFWTNKDGLELTLDGTNQLESSLTIAGNFDLNGSAIITPVDIHEIYFSSSTNNYIETRGVQLPELQFVGSAGEWDLQDDLTADVLTFEAGTFNTNGYSVTTDVWNAFEEYPKHFNFSSSTITVNGTMDLAEFATRNITVEPGTSLIVCEVLNCIITDLYDVQFNNSSTLTMGNHSYNFNSLILNGLGEFRSVNDLTLNNLIFEEDGSTLALDVSKELVVNESIQSKTSNGNPGHLKSMTNGVRAEIESDGNLCVQGFVEFEDIQSELSGVFHAPDGIDVNNNDDIVFDSGITSNTLYWVGESGGVWQQKSNWSLVDGGCPATKDPSNSPNLEFNRNSFTTSPVIVTVPLSEIANNVTFKNAEDLSIDITSSLKMKFLTIDGGFVNFVGKTLDVSGSTELKSSGFLTTDMDNFITDVLVTVSGVYIVRSSSHARVNN